MKVVYNKQRLGLTIPSIYWMTLVEDEKHILLQCPLYDLRYRKLLYGSVDELCPNFKGLNNGKQFNDLSNSDGLIVKAVPRFLIWQRRTCVKPVFRPPRKP